MMKAEPLPPDASTASTGLGIRYVGKDPMHAYAYSGTINVTATPINLLDFTTGAGTIFATLKVMQATAAAEGDDVLASLLFNEQYIFRMVLGKNAFQEFDPNSATATQIVIPPNTLVQVELDNLSGSDADMSAILTGKVYGVKE
tara:strand:+ start:361 stop:792 length:432 start_codon:yes stop_codon:yes gene_type:complete